MRSNVTPRVLIADDQADVLVALKLLLKGEGYQIEQSRSPQQILNALETREFDLVLMDLNYTRDNYHSRRCHDRLGKRRIGRRSRPPRCPRLHPQALGERPPAGHRELNHVIEPSCWLRTPKSAWPTSPSAPAPASYLAWKRCRSKRWSRTSSARRSTVTWATSPSTAVCSVMASRTLPRFVHVERASAPRKPQTQLLVTKCSQPLPPLGPYLQPLQQWGRSTTDPSYPKMGGAGGTEFMHLGVSRRPTVIAILLILWWQGDYTPKVQWTLTALTVGVWLGCTAAIREKVAAPLRTLANLMEAMREGDYPRPPSRRK